MSPNTTTKPKGTAVGNTVTVKASELVGIINDALPFAGVDQWMPFLYGVWIEAEAGTLTATATDRYLMGHSRAEATGGFDKPFWLTLPNARLITRMFKPADRKSDPSVTIVREAGRVRFAHDTTEQLAGTPELGVTVRVDEDHEFPDYVSIVNDIRATAAAVTPGERVAYQAAYLAKFAKVRGGSKVDPMRVTTGGPHRPTLVEVAGHFVGIIMPVRVSDSTADDQVPVGHPSTRKAAADKAAEKKTAAAAKKKTTAKAKPGTGAPDVAA